MKIIWLGLTLLLLVTQPTTAGTPPFIIRNCVNQTQIPAVDLALFFGTDFVMVSKVVKCYINCLFESSGMIVDGKVNKEIGQMAPNPAEAEKINSIVEVCDKLEGDDKCEAGYQFFKCFITYKNNKKQ